MTMMKWMLFAAMLGLLTGCAVSHQALTPDPDPDGVMKQRIQFRGLPAEMQDMMLSGG